MGEEIKVIVFAMGREEYGLDVSHVRTIERMLPMTRVPKTKEFIKGVINLRGVVTPMIDLRCRFGFPAVEYTSLTRIIVVAHGELEVGLIVDSANDVLDIDSDHIESPTEIAGSIKENYLRGIAKAEENRLILLLNLEEVLSLDESVPG